MSHISRIQTQMSQQEYILKALEDLGYRHEAGDLTIRGYAGAQVKVHIKVSIPFSYDIGLRRNGENYEIIADWFGVRGIKQKDFSERLMQRYAYHAARAKLEAQGFILAEEQQEKGQIRMVLRRTA